MTHTAKTRTKWPAAQHLQQAADLLREPDPNLDPEREHYTAPYRDHEGGYRPWRMATRTAHAVLGLPDPDTCTICHTRRPAQGDPR